MFLLLEMILLGSFIFLIFCRYFSFFSLEAFMIDAASLSSIFLNIDRVCLWHVLGVRITAQSLCRYILTTGCNKKIINQLTVEQIRSLFDHN